MGKKMLNGWGVQIIDVFDILWIMDLKDDFNMVVCYVVVIDWVVIIDYINVFEVMIRYLGGFILVYDLFGE